MIVTQQIPEHFQTSAKNMTCDETKEANRKNAKKEIEIIEKILGFISNSSDE